MLRFFELLLIMPENFLSTWAWVLVFKKAKVSLGEVYIALGNCSKVIILCLVIPLILGFLSFSSKSNFSF